MRNKKLCLGTALWGWTGSSIDSFKLLDKFYESGHRYIDSASIYPINKIVSDKGRGLEQISSWLKANGVNDFKVTVKVGGVNNLGSSENNLSYDFLSKQRDTCCQLLGANLDCLMIHWDNTTQSQQIEKKAKLINEVFRDYKVGFSGLKCWREYIKLTDRKEVLVQVKNNLLYDGSSMFSEMKKNRRIDVFTYGTSVSGLKLSPSEYTNESYVSLARGKDFHQLQINKINVPAVVEYLSQSKAARNFYHLGLVLNMVDQYTDAIIVAPKNIDQMNDIFEFLDRFVQFLDFEQELYEANYPRFIKE